MQLLVLVAFAAIILTSRVLIFKGHKSSVKKSVHKESYTS